NCEGTTRHVRSVLEHATIARHQMRRRKPQHLPEWEIPRHDRQNDAEWIKGHERPGRRLGPCMTGAHVAWNRLQKSLGVFSKVFACERALLELGQRVGYTLAHLVGHQFGIAITVPADDLCRPHHQWRTNAEGSPAPGDLGLMNIGCDRSCLL